MKKGRLRRVMIQVSVASSLGLGMTLVFLSGGTDASFAQVSLSPTCSILDPLTGVCETVTSILNPSPTGTSTSTGTPLPPLTRPATTVSSTSTSGTTASTATSGTSGTRTSGGGTTAATLVAGSNSPFGGGPFMGAYGGNFGGGTTYFAPSAQMQTSRQVYFQSAFGTPVSQEVATAPVGQVVDAVPVASAITHVPRTLLLVFPFGVAILSLVTCLVLEVNEGGEGLALRPRL